MGTGLDYCHGSTGKIAQTHNKNKYKLSHTNPLFQKLNFLKLKNIVKLEIAKRMFCFNKSSAKNECCV